jgi:hypothetical protein
MLSSFRQPSFALAFTEVLRISFHIFLSLLKNPTKWWSLSECFDLRKLICRAEGEVKSIIWTSHSFPLSSNFQLLQVIPFLRLNPSRNLMKKSLVACNQFVFPECQPKFRSTEKEWKFLRLRSLSASLPVHFLITRALSFHWLLSLEFPC